MKINYIFNKNLITFLVYKKFGKHIIMKFRVKRTTINNFNVQITKLNYFLFTIYIFIFFLFTYTLRSSPLRTLVNSLVCLSLAFANLSTSFIPFLYRACVKGPIKICLTREIKSGCIKFWLLIFILFADFYF